MTSSPAPVVALNLVDSDEGVDGLLDFAPDRLKTFTFFDNEGKFDKCDVVFRNHDKALLDEARLKEGQQYLVQWGYTSNMSPVYTMIVKSAKESGLNLTVKMKGKATQLDKGRVYQQWVGVRDSDVVREIFEENGFTGIMLDVIDTPVYRTTITQNTSDARFIQKLARRNHFQWWIDAAGAHFRPRQKDLEPYRWYTYRGHYSGDGEILAPGPNTESNFAKDVAKIRIRAIDPYTLEEVVAEQGIEGGNAEEDYSISLGKEQEIGDPDNLEGNREKRLTRTEELNMGFASQSEVNAAAEAMYRRVIDRRYKMTLPIKGDPRVGAKTLIGLRNYSEGYSGLYYVKTAVHQISGGKYRTELKTVRDALGKLYTDKKKGVNGKKNPSEDDQDTERPPKPEELIRVAILEMGPNNTPQWTWHHRNKNSPGGKTFKVEEIQDQNIVDALNAR